MADLNLLILAGIDLAEAVHEVQRTGRLDDLSRPLALWRARFKGYSPSRTDELGVAIRGLLSQLPQGYEPIDPGIYPFPDPGVCIVVAVGQAQVDALLASLPDEDTP